MAHPRVLKFFFGGLGSTLRFKGPKKCIFWVKYDQVNCFTVGLTKGRVYRSESVENRPCIRSFLRRDFMFNSETKIGLNLGRIQGRFWAKRHPATVPAIFSTSLCFKIRRVSRVVEFWRFLKKLSSKRQAIVRATGGYRGHL